jgi:pyruvate kinase
VWTCSEPTSPTPLRGGGAGHRPGAGDLLQASLPRSGGRRRAAGGSRPISCCQRGKPIQLTATKLEGTAGELTIWPSSVFSALVVRSLIAVDFDGAQLEVAKDHAQAVVVDGGRIRSNKAVTVYPAIALPVVTDKDREAIAIGMRRGIQHVALSFASSAEEVALVRSLAPGPR